MSDEMTAIEELSFREAMSELDSIVAKLESNTLELEQSLKLYERGIQLLSSLKGRLTEAQQKVDVLMGQLDVSADDATTDTTLS
ncbi:Exodeoxyribonuclease 7 small subunit [Slackia heliotrinireducens]|uniref:Exodeoxyribonuclease 7 small subunit n=1 Tax=Slackia heliotrinireducens (strain ATCC 29202 / DSM 20476 / NCTC 11029 / RHS 1) TaxID=471855 RepID=C7N5R2_SLAHD|nr:exodeoxyribonuclease VII small subunit [Slackia heliotrinireducens]ACV22247.1 Exodeoxyribonuclease VII small subunit [Slackia heliotrinireducens DSM 20476]VEH00395.1 Exodeoxyribonuclease 7 small subunit [Slackia heliotrinireducens]